MHNNQYQRHDKNAKREPQMHYNLAMLVRRAFFFSITAGTAVLSIPSVYADEISNEKTILLPKINRRGIT